MQLFVPSDLAFRCDEQGLGIPVNKAKDEIERAAKEAGIAICVLLPGVFAESGLNTGYVYRLHSHFCLLSWVFYFGGRRKTLNTDAECCGRLLGVDVVNNRIVFSGDSKKQVLNIWSVLLSSSTYTPYMNTLHTQRRLPDLFHYRPQAKY